MKLADSTPSYSPISIGYDFSNFIKPSTMSEEIFSAIKETLFETANEFRKFLQIQHEDFELLYRRDIIELLCYVDNVGSNYRNYLKTYDIFIFVMLDDNTHLSEYALASAAPCITTEDERPRPIAGILYINQNIDFNLENTYTYLKSILLHEITHALIFNKELLSYLNITEEDESGTYITSSVVLNAVKKHFGCNSITRFPLENQGGSGSAGSHWESRYMLGDYMEPHDYLGAVMSDITLALFEATGYYKTKSYSGGLFKFGKNAGCDFFNKKCIEDDKPITSDFCDIPNGPMCSSSRNIKARCYLYDQERWNITATVQYFKNHPYWEGFYYADYCPVAFHYYSYKSYLDTSCYESTYSLDEEYGETIGFDSLCFNSSLLPTSSSKEEKYQPICYKVTCNSAQKTYDIQIGSQSITCPTNGGSINSRNFKGYIECPKYDDICSEENDIVCSEMFDCFTKLAKNDNYNYGTTPRNASSVNEDANIPDSNVDTTDSDDGMTDNIIPIREDANCIYFNLSLLILILLILFSN